MTRTIFGGFIVVFLLGLYVYATVAAIQLATNTSAGTLHESFANILTIVGGLISALVVTVLAVTPPGDAPGTNLAPAPSAAADLTEQQKLEAQKKWIGYVTIAYIAVWLGCGIAAFVTYLNLDSPDTTAPALTSAAKTWFGLAVAAAYSYLGVKPVNG
jgi:hypothetical protein